MQLYKTMLANATDEQEKKVLVSILSSFSENLSSIKPKKKEAPEKSLI